MLVHLPRVSVAVAISGNFVDASNKDRAVAQLQKAGLRDTQAAELALYLESME